MADTAKERVVVSFGGGVEFIVAAGDPIPDGAEVVRGEPLPSTVADVAVIPQDVTVSTEQDTGVENPSFEVFGTSTREVAKPEPDADGGGEEASSYPDESATRAELDEYAVSIGLDPDDYSNKTEIADAIAEYHEEEA